MYLLLILFFGSLLSIIFMIGRKLRVSNSTIEIMGGGEAEEMLNFEEWKNFIIQNSRVLGHRILVLGVWVYVKCANFVKEKYGMLKTRLRKNNGMDEEDASAPKEPNGFLKVVSDYKRKVRQIKHRIKREEEENKV